MAIKALVTTVIFLFSSVFTNSWAVQESEVLSRMIPLLDAEQLYKMGEFKSRFKAGPKSGQLRIRYSKFGSGKGPLGSLVIAPGRTESSLKYLEVAYDFIQRGYSPVYAIDHRGQGFSDRRLQDMQKGHVENFEFYILDFNTFVNSVVLQDPEVDTNKLFLISNSMGGAITAAYLQKYSNHPFKASAFFGSMMKIIYPEGITELKAAALSAAVCTLGIKYQGSGCTDYAPGRGPFRWDERIFEGNNLTQSRTRFEFRNELWKRNPKIALGGPTMKWVGEAARANANLRTSEQVKKINIPMQIYSAELDSINDNEAQAEFCNRAQRGLCQRLIVKGAEHEILMEKDSLRTPAMNAMWTFFEGL